MDGNVSASGSEGRTGTLVVAAMSGGVDSSVAAALLLEAGYRVMGVTLRLRKCDNEGGSCCGGDAVARARAVAGRLGIPHAVEECADEFRESVLRPAWKDYARGRTPSPCLLCNERIKFGYLLAWARGIGASAVGTGHYARILRDPRGNPVLFRGTDPRKDQSYFLAGLKPEQLDSILFPIGHLHKPLVREKARALGLPSAETRDSQDACLVGGPGRPFAEMLRERFGAPARPGRILDEEGRILGRHPGLHRYTVGQRRGLLGSERRHWVRALREEDASVLVTTDERGLLSRRMTVEGLTWTGEDPLDKPLLCSVQIRYRHTAAAARVERIGPDSAQVLFEEPVRAITPGQAAVLYRGDRVLGRGWIRSCGEGAC
jgi:tRNA-specific 2-thiouridylase